MPRTIPSLFVSLAFSVSLVACGDDDGGRPAVDASQSQKDAPSSVIDAPATDVDATPVSGAVTVPAGAFTMGCANCSADEAPPHDVMLSAFQIDRTEVTQSKYEECIVASMCTEPSANYTPGQTPDHPVVSVTWLQAQNYCEFRGGSLPTEAQWEKAARGTDGRTYPWGNTAADCNFANVDTCGGDVLAVGPTHRTQGASPYGALDMAGNVWEWTHDYYAADTYASHGATPDPTGPASGTTRVYRGGSAGNMITLATTTNRADTYNPTVGGSGLGFRCAY